MIDYLEKFFEKKPALIVGIRLCRKTKSIEHFAIQNYKNYIYINFWTHPEFKSDFESSLEVEY